MGITEKITGIGVEERRAVPQGMKPHVDWPAEGG